jgi:Zn-dependent metalloprotease
VQRRAIPAFSKATGSVNMLRFPAARALKLAGAVPKEKALAFLKQNQQLFAIWPGQDVYLAKESKKYNYGLEHVELQQYYKGIPVFDGTLQFNFNKNNALSSVNGNFILVGDVERDFFCLPRRSCQ